MNRKYLVIALAALAVAVPAVAAPDTSTFRVTSSVPVKDVQTGTAIIRPGTPTFRVDQRGNILFGPNKRASRLTGDYGQRAIPDAAYLADKRRFYTRSILLAEIGDPPDVVLSRAEGVYPDGQPRQVKAGASLGSIFWRGWTAEGEFLHRAAQITGRTADDVTRRAAGGTLDFYTTPRGGTALKARLTIGHDGGLNIAPASSLPERPTDHQQPEMRGGGVLYVQDGALWFVGGNGTRTMIAPA